MNSDAAIVTIDVDLGFRGLGGKPVASAGQRRFVILADDDADPTLLANQWAAARCDMPLGHTIIDISL